MKITGGPYDSVDDSQSEKGVRRIRMMIFILELLWLPVWWLSALLSIPGNGAKWQYWVVFGPLWAYPGLVIVAFAFSEALLVRNKLGQIRTVMLLPPILSYGYPIAISFAASLVKEVFEIFA